MRRYIGGDRFYVRLAPNFGVSLMWGGRRIALSVKRGFEVYDKNGRLLKRRMSRTLRRK